MKSVFESFDDVVCEKVESGSCVQSGTLYESLWLNTAHSIRKDDMFISVLVFLLGGTFADFEIPF